MSICFDQDHKPLWEDVSCNLYENVKKWEIMWKVFYEINIIVNILVLFQMTDLIYLLLILIGRVLGGVLGDFGWLIKPSILKALVQGNMVKPLVFIGLMASQF